MTNSPASALPQKRISSRAWLILSAVVMAVAVPILPLRFLGIPGPDFPDVNQVVTSSKNWLSKVASRMELTEKKSDGGVGAPASSSPAEQIRMLDEAAQQLTTEIERSPSDPALQNRLGLVYLSLGEIDQACERFQKAVSLSRLGITGLTQKIALLKQEGRTSDASTALVDASKLNVELSAAHSNLARVYEKRGEHDKVLAELDMLNREGVLFDSTVAPTATGGHSTALSPQVAKDLARAEAYLQARQLPQAANEYKRVLLQDPNVALAHHRLGTILAVSGNAALAVDELEMAAKLDPGSPEVQNDLGLAYQTVGMREQAVKAFERALALEPRTTDAAVNLSNLYSSQGRLGDAASVLTQAIQNNPNSANAHNNLGEVLVLQGKQGPALYEFQKAVALEPNLPSAHYGLGSLLMDCKQYMPAVHEFKQALALNPHFSQAQLKMEESYRRAGMTVGSAQALN